MSGSTDRAERVAQLSDRLSDGLKPLAAVAYDYRWSWLPGAEAVFREISPLRWERAGKNPVQFLNDLWPATQGRAEQDRGLMEQVRWLADAVAGDADRPDRPRPGIDGPVAFMCAEFGLHASLPQYSGGLGVLAGDILKEASDQALPLVGVGLFYERGYFRQRLDLNGWQQEYWLVTEPHHLPLARVRDAEGEQLRLSVNLFGADLSFRVWRVDVGRVPLYLLDTELGLNDPVQRWTTGRLYDASRAIRLAQYGLLGVGGVRVLQALGIEPAVIHLNEGHPALAALELAAQDVARGSSLEDALATARSRVVFTTHTPVAAGNETYSPEEISGAYGDLAARLGMDTDAFLGLMRIHPEDADEQPGMTPLALRMSRRRNGVSALHGEVAREMWQPLFGGAVGDVPITHVTNGAHVPTFVSDHIRVLFERHLGEDWLTRSGDPATWEPVRSIPNAELWAARCRARAELVEYVRGKSQQDRLLRGEQLDYVRAVADSLHEDALTLGFGRRLATYKRVHLLAHDPDRARQILGGEREVQLLIAGKAHPSDDAGKQTLQDLFQLKRHSDLARRVVFLEDYDLEIARRLVAGCDVWINLPRRPMEASGTSGMKATFNGVLQLSVRDGWWAEAYDGMNGWAIAGEQTADQAADDARDAARFYDLLENEVIPLFFDRGADGVADRWCDKVKHALVTCGPRFSATRMLNDYVERIYPAT